MKSKTWRALLAAISVAVSMPAAMADTKKPLTPQEQEIRKAVEQVVSNPDVIDSVTKTSYGNFYEVVLTNGDILYVEPNGGFLISGSLVDIKAKRNVTADRLKELSQINFADLPLANAIKQVKGNGKRVLVTFEDPNCSYCKKLARDLVNIKDTTVYTFLIPILAEDSKKKSEAIWCSQDRAKAWNDWMVDNKMPVGGTKACDTPIAKNMDLQKRFRINGTPTMFLVDGSRLGGYVQPAELERSITEATDKVAKK
ncbi:DsbC family protein [Viridibacterium curvum]|uniref:Thiol:disulfide interchange protein n=1 Tax=Viridibacterium curvum TaxID=1101404 RepID=A0ABP9QJ38_9RHOO